MGKSVLVPARTFSHNWPPLPSSFFTSSSSCLLHFTSLLLILCVLLLVSALFLRIAAGVALCYDSAPLTWDAPSSPCLQRYLGH